MNRINTSHFLFSALALCAALLLVSQSASAVTVDWVPVGDAGNADDSTGYGGVAYNYNIGKYDITVGQYTDFLNAVAATDTYGLYNANMTSDLNIACISRTDSAGSSSYSVINNSANLPITEVSWGDAARFANWLQNGQPGLGIPGGVPEDTHSTEDGAYTLNGDTSVFHEARNPGATIFIPSESEWYKAAYYDPTLNNGAGGYYQYPFSSNTTPTSAMPGSTPNTGNFYDSTTGYAVTHSTSFSIFQNYLSAVGAYTNSASHYGAFDMGGDVFQWNEALIGGFRGLRGGSWLNGASSLASSFRYGYGGDVPPYENPEIGFRVASVPEPSSLILAGIAGVGLLAVARRRAR